MTKEMVNKMKLKLELFEHVQEEVMYELEVTSLMLIQ